MVEYSKNDIIQEDALDSIFHALSDRTRRSLLSKITTEPKRISDLASDYDVSLNAISKHIKVLEKANLIERNIEGRTHYCRMNPSELITAQEWINQYEEFWTSRLDSLESFLINKDKEK
jgi:DNA-binding transcriptional ArsR family regulator